MESQEPKIQESSIDITKLSEMNQVDLITTLQELLDNEPIETIRDTVEVIKQLFYKKQQQEQLEIEEQPEIENIETENDAPETTEEVVVNDEITTENDEKINLAAEFKSILAIYRAKKAEYNEKIAAIQEENYSKKREIITQLEQLVSSENDLSETINSFRNLQTQWREIGQVPATQATDLWKDYNHYQEQFYDLIKINAALREYDFKKNLEAKNDLIAQAEVLSNADDVVLAFQKLQKLHDEWREIGPVDREIREEIWAKFKDISSVINKKHQAYFEDLKEQEAKLTAEKEAICTFVETIDFESLKSYKDWDEKTKEVVSHHDSFKSNSYIERRVNTKMYKRFRVACDKFFEEKNNFYKAIKETLSANLEKKRLLVEKAQQLQNSTEWRSTTEKLIALQKEWKTIGPTPKKSSDAIWAKFVAACDKFFAQKEANFKTKKTEEQENLRLKLEAIEAINNYEFIGNDEEDFATLRKLSDQFLAVGHIPFKEKDKVYNAYKEASNKQFSKLRSKRRTAQLSFNGDRNKLMRQYDLLKQQIATYENNIGFFSNNKKSNNMVKEFERKIENLKQDLSIIVEQIKGDF
ncbi:MAG: DUF349 domain-containing protein [bacterium]